MRVWVSVGEERHADGGMGAHSDLSDLEAHELPAYGGKKVEDVDAFFNRGPSNDTGDLDAQPFDEAWPKREAEDIDLGYAPVIGRASAEPQQQALSSDNISDSASTRIRKWRDSASTTSTPPSWSSPSSFTSPGLAPSDSRSFQHVPLNQLLFGAPPFIFTCTLLLSLFLALFINLFLPPR